MTPYELRQEILKIVDLDELRLINKIVAWQFKQASSLKKYEFRLGQSVTFDAGAKGGVLTGSILKLNRLKAKVVVDQYGRKVTWTVPFNMLKAA